MGYPNIQRALVGEVDVQTISETYLFPAVLLSTHDTAVTKLELQ